ncbi:hypothetical protein HDU98_011242 [Podochytrium sp. JEL0797]|nr:hypothetical protein HDU98_011242 [Podochytrium sp. JEL0797]
MGISETCNGSSACEVLLQYVVPSLITAVALALAPLSAVNQCIKNGELGAVNTLPFALCAMNASIWIIYSWYIRDYFIFLPNVIGYISSLYFTLSLLPISPPQTVRQITLAVCGMSTFIFLSTGFVFLVNPDQDTGKLLMGCFANVVLVLFYGSPLAVCFKVMRERDTSSLNLMIGVVCAINCILWTAYGFAVQNPFIYSPNGAGLIFSIFQILLIFLFPKKPQTLSASVSEERLQSSREESAVQDVDELEGEDKKQQFMIV